MNLFTELLKKSDCVLTLKFEEKILKLLKFIDSIKLINEENKFQLRAYRLGMKIKSNTVLFLKKSFCDKA